MKSTQLLRDMCCLEYVERESVILRAFLRDLHKEGEVGS
jgi:hypothetical protein